MTAGEMGGIVGLIIAVPILAVAKVAIVHAREHLIKANRQQAEQLFDKPD